MTSLPRVIWKDSAILLLVLLPTLSDVVRADSDAPPPPPRFEDRLGVAASVRLALFSKDLSFTGDSWFLIGSVWLTAKPEEILGFRTYFDARAQAQNLTRTSDLHWELREAYAETSLGNFDLKVGRQITIWGRADKVNPTDVWTSRDYKLLATDDEDQRLGTAAVQAAWTQWGHRLVGYWQPEFRIPVIPFPPLPPGVTLQNVSPSDTLAQFGLKLDHSGGRLDYSVSYAHVVNRAPDLTVLSAGPSGVLVGLQYNMIDMVGADAAFNVGNYGLRGEVAYINTKDHSGTDPLTQNANLFLVLGGDRTFKGVFNVNVQYLYKHTFDWKNPSRISDSNISLLARELNLASNQSVPDNHGASLHVDFKAFNETLEIDAAVVVWFVKGDGLFRPKLTYAFTDRLKGAIGGYVYFGPSNTFFGSLSPVSTAFAELRYGF